MKALHIASIACSALILTLAQPSTASACGLKLTVKAAKGKRPIPPSDNPSRVLLLGDAPNGLSRTLAQAGHEVDSAPSPEKAKSTDYKVVMVDEPQRDAAERKFKDSRVVSYASGGRQSWRRVELALKRAPVSAKADREVVATKTNDGRQLVAAGSEGGERAIVGAGGGAAPAAAGAGAAAESEPTAEPEPTPAVAQRQAEVEPEPEPTPAYEPEPEPRRAAAPVAARAEPRPAAEPRTGPGRVGFQLGSSRLTASSYRGLAQTARHMKNNPDVTILIQGHTDSSGTSEFNLSLSERRAERVAAYLRKKGVPSSRITVQGLGEEDPPYAPPSNPRNRCVVITLSDQ